MIDDLNFDKAMDLWRSFKKEVLYNNRFFVKHEVLDFVQQIAVESKTILKKGEILYRARIYSDDTFFTTYMDDDLETEGKNLSILEMLQINDKRKVINLKKQTGFWGYDAENSHAPHNNDGIGEGRANPSFIKYLYTSHSPYTALAEVRPYLGEYVSIAEIEVMNDLLIADFSLLCLNAEESVKNYLAYIIVEEFSKPNKSDMKTYIPTQYITEYLRHIDYDGIRFNSSLHKLGANITIFNPDKCKPISSKLYKTDGIFIEAECIAPANETRITHHRLKNRPLLPLLNKNIDNKK